ncbi:hypothetical protein DBR28_17500 [Chryseobacterium sp. HMWF028]|nr:hypothetical protein DBR28_17500 [Chryseobacterium sp. HMWF028]
MVKPNINFSDSRKGVVPDVIVTESMQDIIDKKDPQLDWIKNEIAKEKENKGQ